MAVTRFAPSPNGPLHLGHAYAAVVAHDRARRDGGRFLLRIEDIDGARSRAGLGQEFAADLEWLGLAWDGAAIRQSQRSAAHLEAGDALKRQGLLYPCICTRAEIAAAAREHGPDGPIYPGTCKARAVDPAGAAWRLDLGEAVRRAGPLTWHDELHGPQVAAPKAFGDVVLLRKDAPASYHLAVVLDDAADRITQVTRGIDLFAATHIHRLLQALLGLPVPVWHHHPVLLGPDGRKLAKRREAAGIADLRRAGADGAALAQALREGRFPAGVSLSGGLEVRP
jgi:glutamyl-Q tRNA(Asp) synthetase